MKRPLILTICALLGIGLVAGLVVELAQAPHAQRTAAASQIVKRCSKTDMKLVIDRLQPQQSKFSDEFQLAQNAPRISLAPILSNMQDTRRAYEAAPYPDCYAATRQHYIASMDDSISGFIAFMGQADDTIVQADFQQASQEINTAVTDLAAIGPQ